MYITRSYRSVLPGLFTHTQKKVIDKQSPQVIKVNSDFTHISYPVSQLDQIHSLYRFILKIFFLNSITYYEIIELIHSTNIEHHYVLLFF